jgi:hypothetical protein
MDAVGDFRHDVRRLAAFDMAGGLPPRHIRRHPDPPGVALATGGRNQDAEGRKRSL